MSMYASEGEVPAVVANATKSRAVAGEAANSVTYGGEPEKYLENQSVPALLKYLGLFLKYRKLAAAICAGFFFGGFVITFLMPRVYTATTSLQIDREAAKVVRSQDSPVENQNDPQFYTNSVRAVEKQRPCRTRGLVTVFGG